MKSKEIMHRLMHTPLIPEDVYTNLPPFLKELCSKFKPGRKRDVFLSSALVMLGGIMYNTKTQFRGEELYPHSFLSIVAPSAKGKGIARHAKRLMESLHYHLMMQSIETQKDDVSKSPIPKRLFIPANTSYAMFINILYSNQGKGIIFEEEIDTMNKSLQQDWGNYSDELRRIYDNQAITYARKIDKVDIEIREPKVAMVLTGTPSQIKTFIPSAENGLFSRMLFYGFDVDPVWDDIDTKESNLRQYFTEQGESIQDLYKFLESNEVTYTLNEACIDDMNAHFKIELDESLYTHGHESSSLVFRNSVHLIRLAMILGSIRKWGANDAQKQSTLTQKDYKTAKLLSQTYLRHSLAMLELIPYSEVKEHRSDRE